MESAGGEVRGEVGDRFFDDVGEDYEERGGLFFREAMGFEALDEVEGVEVVLRGGGCGSGSEGAFVRGRKGGVAVGVGGSEEEGCVGIDG